MLNAQVGKVRKEHKTRLNKREDFVLTDTKLAVAIDGAHHFKDHHYGGNRSVNARPTKLCDTQRTDIDEEDGKLPHPGVAQAHPADPHP